jgi:amidohydrolase
MASSVRFLFQPCEETPPGGALGMIANGCLDGVDEVFGLHNDPGTLIGRVRLRAGAMTAAADRFQLTVRGRGCHAARPQDGLDPIPAMCGVVQEWQTIISRRLDPVHPVVVSVTQFNAGTTFNIIPDTATICGTVRTFHESDRKIIEQQMRASLVGLEARGYSCEFEYARGYDSIVNHASGVRRVADVARRVLGEPTSVDDNTDPVAWGEDFSYYLQKVPGAFFFLGSGNPMKGITEPLHSARFDVDEDCLPIGAAIMAGLVLNP